MLVTAIKEPGVSRVAPSGEEYQYLYSLLWSSFLDLDRYSASRAYKRFRPYSTAWVARELLWHLPVVKALSPGGPDSKLEHLRLATPFQKLALWSIAYGLFDEPRRPRASATVRQRSSAGTADDATLLRDLGGIYRAEYERLFQVTPAAFRHDPDSRPLLPPLPELGIGETGIHVVAGPRRATATLTSLVQLPYEKMRCVIDPTSWGVCDYLQPRPWSSEGHESRLEMSLRLPGGSFDDGAKLRQMSLEYSKSEGSFEARVDYEATETTSFVPESEWIQESRDGSDDAPDPDYDKGAVHVDCLRGYLSVEKVAGRPGWTRLVAQRVASFESPNHDRFRVETLTLWLVVELISFVAARKPQISDGHVLQD